MGGGCQQHGGGGGGGLRHLVYFLRQVSSPILSPNSEGSARDAPYPSHSTPPRLALPRLAPPRPGSGGVRPPLPAHLLGLLHQRKVGSSASTGSPGRHSPDSDAGPSHRRGRRVHDHGEVLKAVAVGTLFQEPTNPLKASYRPNVDTRTSSAPRTGRMSVTHLDGNLAGSLCTPLHPNTHTYQTPENIPPDQRILRSQGKLCEQYSALPPSIAKAFQACLLRQAEQTRTSSAPQVSLSHPPVC